MVFALLAAAIFIGGLTSVLLVVSATRANRNDEWLRERALLELGRRQNPTVDGDDDLFI